MVAHIQIVKLQIAPVALVVVLLSVPIYIVARQNQQVLHIRMYVTRLAGHAHLRLIVLLDKYAQMANALAAEAAIAELQASHAPQDIHASMVSAAAGRRA